MTFYYAISFYSILFFCHFLCCTVNNYVKCSSNEDCPEVKDKPLECHNDTVRPACWCKGSRLSLYIQQDGGTCLGLYVNLSCHYDHAYSPGYMYMYTLSHSIPGLRWASSA